MELLELFKDSKINSIFVGGRSDGKIGTSCDFFYPVGSELVVTANKNEDGQLVFGMCSLIIDLKTGRGNNQRNLDVIGALSQWDNDSPKLDPVKIVVPVYFYPSERGEESFMSKFSL